MTEHELKFEESKELKAARELLEIAKNSGHHRPIIDFAGLETFFDTLGQEEHKVFDLQLAVGRLANENEKARSLLRELVKENDRWNCELCGVMLDHGKRQHDPDCLLLDVKECLSE